MKYESHAQFCSDDATVVLHTEFDIVRYTQNGGWSYIFGGQQSYEYVEWNETLKLTLLTLQSLIA